MRKTIWKELRSLRRQKRKGVFRITVDDVLAPDIIRFEFCLLNEGVSDFLYELDVWGEGYEVIAYGDTYERELGIPLSWDTLRGGQVFLYGEFEVIGEPRNPKSFRYKPGNDEFMRIDDIPSFRDEIRRIYSKLLRRD